MITPAQLLRRVRALFGWRRLEDSMQEEMRFHLEMETDAGVRSGLTPEEAERGARVSFGGVERWREEGREARGVQRVLDLAGDLRYAVRILVRAPIFTAVAVLTLGLGIGANSAIFSVVNTVLLQPLPYPEPERLIKVWGEGHSRAEFTRIRRLKSTEGVAAYFPAWDMSLGGDGEPLRVITALVSSEFFEVLGVPPLYGRFFRPGEDRTGTEPVAVLSYGLWRDRFGGDAGLVGRIIELDGVKRTVVGVAPRGFSYPGPSVRLWVPLELNEAESGPFWGAYGHHLIGRLASGVTREQARAELQERVETIRLENPIWRPDSVSYHQGVTINQLQDQLVKGSRPLLGVLLGAVGLVLLIACANVANLLLVRGTARQRELAIRATLGAGRRRLARQLLAEGAVLALAGGIAALAFALATLRGLLGLLPPETPRLADVTLDGTAIGFTLLVTLITGLGFGLLPALRLAHTDGQDALSGGRSTAGVHPRRLASALVSGQIALAVVLAIGAGLLLRSLARLLEVDPGFETVQVVSARLNPPRMKYLQPDQVRGLYSSLLESLEGQAGIQAAAISTQIPFDQSSHGMAMWIDGWTVDPNKLDLFELRRVTPRFFQAMGVSIVRGRGFGPEDQAGSERVVIVSESAARRFWADREVIGGQIRYPWPGWMRVVGVAADVRNNDLREAALPALYIPFDQEPDVAVAVVARTTSDPRMALAAIRTAVAGQAADVPVSDEATMARLVERSVAAPRSASRLLLGFGGLALLLGTVGTYGLVAYGVERRTREIALRVAIGAPRERVVRLVLGEGLRLAAVGVVLGVGAALLLARFLRSLLYEVGPTDPLTFAAVPLLLALTALIASLVPALRAAAIDPSAALKQE